MNETQKWPDRLWLVRHGESAGNVARDAAEAAGHPVIDIALRDADVPLSALGERQARALGEWFGRQDPDETPTAVLVSPYRRARQTAQIALAAAGLGDNPGQGGDMGVTDERLREREFGILDRLTHAGIVQKYPEQAELRRLLGKFYHRPPGGESWCDVILRLRSLVDTLTREYRGERVLLVCHSVVILCFRYLLERMDEAQILAVDRDNEVANCSVTSYAFDPAQGRRGKLALREFNFVAPLEEAGETVTDRPDAPAILESTHG